MNGRMHQLRDAIRRPLRLSYHPLYRFYAGGSLTRRFRGLPPGADDFWSEDWVGSCTCANNSDPDSRAQGLSNFEVPGLGDVALKEIVEALPEEMVGSDVLQRFGPETGLLVKLLSPRGPVPVHAHPTREWARRHLGSAFGKTEAWVFLETPGDGVEAAHAGAGFLPEIERDWFVAAVRRHDAAAIRSALHRLLVRPGEVYIAPGGLPQYLGPRLSFIEVQEPSDHIVIAETDGGDDAGATMGLGWDVALDMIDYSGLAAEANAARVRQQATLLRSHGSSRESRLVNADALLYFDIRALQVEDVLGVADGRFSIAIVEVGSGSLEGDFGTVPIARGATFALPAALEVNVRAGKEPLRLIRCLGPEPRPVATGVPA
jgi:mannose-6-phosphate isomerase